MPMVLIHDFYLLIMATRRHTVFCEINTLIISLLIDENMEIFIIDKKMKDPVKEFVIGKTKLNPVAFRIRVIDAIPKNDSGKISYKELANYYEG